MITVENIDAALAGERVIITLSSGAKALLMMVGGALSLTYIVE